MSFAKNFGLKFAAFIFSISIFGLAVVFSINSVFGTPDSLKASLQQGKAYDAIAAQIAKQLVSDTAEQNIAIDNKALEKATASAITPELVQQHSEKVIDGTYSWLDGTTPTPDFRLNTTDIQKQISTNLSGAAVDRVKELPPCSPAQLQQLDLNNIDPFSVPCQPPGLNLKALRGQFQRELLANNTGAPTDDIITAEDATNEAGQNVFAEAKRVPQTFQLGQKLPWIFAVLAILTAVLVIFFNEARLRGVRSLSITLLISGASLLLFMTIVSFVFRQIGANITGVENEAGNAAFTVIQSLTNQVNSPLKVFAIIYLLVGITGLVLPQLMKYRQPYFMPPKTPPNDHLSIPPPSNADSDTSRQN